MTDSEFRHIRCTTMDGVLVITLLPDTIRDNDVCIALREEFLGAFGRNPAVGVVMDFGSVKFMATAGFLPLLNLNRLVRESGGRIVLCNLADNLRSVFKVTRVLISPESPAGLFEAESSVDAAVTRARQLSASGGRKPA